MCTRLEIRRSELGPIESVKKLCFEQYMETLVDHGILRGRKIPVIDTIAAQF